MIIGSPGSIGGNGRPEVESPSKFTSDFPESASSDSKFFREFNLNMNSISSENAQTEIAPSQVSESEGEFSLTPADQETEIPLGNGFPAGTDDLKGGSGISKVLNGEGAPVMLSAEEAEALQGLGKFGMVPGAGVEMKAGEVATHVAATERPATAQGVVSTASELAAQRKNAGIMRALSDFPNSVFAIKQAYEARLGSAPVSAKFPGGVGGPRPAAGHAVRTGADFTFSAASRGARGPASASLAGSLSRAAFPKVPGGGLNPDYASAPVNPNPAVDSASGPGGEPAEIEFPAATHVAATGLPATAQGVVFTASELAAQRENAGIMRALSDFPNSVFAIKQAYEARLGSAPVSAEFPGGVGVQPPAAGHSAPVGEDFAFSAASRGEQGSAPASLAESLSRAASPGVAGGGLNPDYAMAPIYPNPAVESGSGPVREIVMAEIESAEGVVNLPLSDYAANTWRPGAETAVSDSLDGGPNNEFFRKLSDFPNAVYAAKQNLAAGVQPSAGGGGYPAGFTAGSETEPPEMGEKVYEFKNLRPEAAQTAEPAKPVSAGQISDPRLSFRSASHSPSAFFPAGAKDNPVAPPQSDASLFDHEFSSKSFSGVETGVALGGADPASAETLPASARNGGGAAGSETIQGKIDVPAMAALIRKAYANQRESFHIKLNPGELGQVKIILTRSGNDKIQVRIIADNDRARKKLESQIGELKRNLSEEDLSVSSLEIRSSGEEDSGTNFAFSRGSERRESESAFKPKTNEGGFKELMDGSEEAAHALI